jgi:threonylcarbamoyladenosine tRNA methylthiotransferase MtaB
VFTFSARPGTTAEKMPNQVDFPIRKERNARLRKILGESAQAYQSKFLNQKLRVLWESVTKMDSEMWQMQGLTDNYLRVHANANQNLWNQITPVRLSSIDEQGITGTI